MDITQSIELTPEQLKELKAHVKTTRTKLSKAAKHLQIASDHLQQAGFEETAAKASQMQALINGLLVNFVE